MMLQFNKKKTHYIFKIINYLDDCPFFLIDKNNFNIVIIFYILILRF
jgi:hypothetical protein